MTITADRIRTIRAGLTVAGDDWQSHAANVPGIASAIRGDGTRPDRCTLTDLIETPTGDTAATLYRDPDTGTWWIEPAPVSPVDVFTRILTDHIGGRVSVTDNHGNNHHATVEAVGSGVVTLLDGDATDLADFEFIENAVPKTSRHHIRIDQLSTVTTHEH